MPVMTQRHGFQWMNAVTVSLSFPVASSHFITSLPSVMHLPPARVGGPQTWLLHTKSRRQSPARQQLDFLLQTAFDQSSYESLLAELAGDL